MFPYFNSWGIFVVIPLYLLHSLVLITIIYRKGRPTLATLYFAGTLFGLYEAYLTKVLWNPDWGAAIKIGEVAVFEVIVLVLFWHAWMSFIFPLLAMDTWLTKTNEILSGFPARLQRLFHGRRGWVILAILSGLFISINAPSAEKALLSGLGSIAVLGTFGFIFRRTLRNHNYTITDLLPNKNQLRLLIGSLGLMYLVLGVGLRPDMFPPFSGHFVIWILYGFCTWMFILALRASKSQTSDTHLQDEAVSKSVRPTLWLGAMVTFTLVAVLAEVFLVAIEGIIGAIGWFGISVPGILSLVILTRQVLRNRKNLNTPT